MECDRCWMFSLCSVPDVYLKLLFAWQKGQEASLLDPGPSLWGWALHTRMQSLSRGLTPASNPVLHSHSLCLGRMGKRARRVKVRKLVVGDEHYLTRKEKQGINQLLLTFRWVFGHLQKSRAPSWVTVTREDKFHNSKYSSFLLF